MCSLHSIKNEENNVYYIYDKEQEATYIILFKACDILMCNWKV